MYIQLSEDKGNTGVERLEEQKCTLLTVDNTVSQGVFGTALVETMNKDTILGYMSVKSAKKIDGLDQLMRKKTDRKYATARSGCCQNRVERRVGRQLQEICI